MQQQAQITDEWHESFDNSPDEEWVNKQSWRKVYEADERTADRVKSCLYPLSPTQDISGDPWHNKYEANLRAALQIQIIPELGRNELAVVFEVARLLALFPIEYE